MGNVLLSIQPHWCRMLFSREKIVELRKSRPRGKESQFKVYLYETKQGRGAVVEECLCFCAEKVEQKDFLSITAGSCLTENEINQYANRRHVYAWYLSNVIEYAKPQPLSAFSLNRAPQSWCYLKGA